MIDFADKFPLFIHLISTIVGFGAVIVIDVWGFFLKPQLEILPGTIAAEDQGAQHQERKLANA